MIFYLALGLWGLVTANHIINLIYLHLKSNESCDLNSSITVVIPCRNEQDNISKCIDSCLRNKELIEKIILVDDESTDKTLEIMKNYSTNRIIEILSIKKPDDWIGKNFACFEGAKQVKSEFILFLDADIELIDLRKLKINKKYSLTFIFPIHSLLTIGEKLMIPFRIMFLGLYILPLYMMNFRIFNSPIWANAYGYFLLINKQDYFKIGGHEKIKDKIIEDIELSKLFVKNKFKIQAVRGIGIAEIRMYTNINDIWNGFIKNYYLNFGKSILNLFLLWIIIFNYFIFPLMILNNIFISICIIIINLLFYIYFIKSITNKINLLDFFSSLIGILLNFICCLDSYRHGVFKLGYYWKGRKIS